MVLMSTSWTSAAEERYQTQVAEQMRKGCHALCLLAITLFPAFALLDYVAHPEQLGPLWSIRFSTVAAYLILYLLLRRGAFASRPYGLALALAGLAAVSITTMCLLLGGYQSPYYAGVNLVVLALVVVLPVGAADMALGVALVIGLYLFGILSQSGLAIANVPALLNNLYFLLATGIIGVTAAHLTERLRRESFRRYLELEQAQAHLKQSKDLLQMELKSEQGNVEVLVREITERKAELERALQLREEFISLASHELNTPLTSLKLQTQLAQRKLAKQALAPEHLDKLIGAYDSQLKRLIRIVGDMFDIARIRSGKLELERAPTELRALVEDVVARTVEKFDERQAEVHVLGAQLSGDWDGFRIEQVVLNLLTNAIKYGAGKPVWIELARDGNSALIRVRDQGIGIATESQAKIFERFERAVQPRDFAGLGLGLYISQQIVAAHGGAIEVESQPGAGSTFTVRLPFAPVPPATEPAAPLAG